MNLTPFIYKLPVLLSKEYSKSSDVYSFAIVVYEIVASEIPFNNTENGIEIIDEIVTKGNRPELKDSISDCYKDLIKRYLSTDPNKRPSFCDIVDELKNNSDFIIDIVRKEDIYSYMKYIDEYHTTFDASNQILEITELIESNKTSKEASKSKNKKSKKKLDSKEPDKDSKKTDKKHHNHSKKHDKDSFFFLSKS